MATAQRKSFTQRLVTALLPGRAEEIERQSRQWLVSGEEWIRDAPARSKR